MSKLLLIVAVALSLLAAGVGYLNKARISELSDARKAAEEARAKAVAAQTKASEDLKAAKRELVNAIAEKEGAVAEAERYKSDLDAASSRLAELETASKSKDEQIASLTQQAAEREQRVDDFIPAPSKPTASTDSPELETKIREQDAVISSLQSRLNEATSKLDAVQRKESDRIRGRMQESVRGRVLAVNGAWNFVVLSLGNRQGVVNNSELLVKRGSQLIGKVRVTAVEPTTSVADIVANSVQSGFSVRPGDQVIYQASRN